MLFRVHLPSAALLVAPVVNGLPRAHHSQIPLNFISPQETFTPSLMSVPDHYPFVVREQNESICDAGSKQWTGQVEVSEEKKLFFCMILLKEFSILLWRSSYRGI